MYILCITIEYMRNKTWWAICDLWASHQLNQPHWNIQTVHYFNASTLLRMLDIYRLSNEQVLKI